MPKFLRSILYIGTHAAFGSNCSLNTSLRYDSSRLRQLERPFFSLVDRASKQISSEVLIVCHDFNLNLAQLSQKLKVKRRTMKNRFLYSHVRDFPWWKSDAREQEKYSCSGPQRARPQGGAFRAKPPQNFCLTPPKFFWLKVSMAYN